LPTLKLYMFLLGGRPTARNTEQHDIFFGIGENIKDLIPEMIRFWPEAKRNLHVDAWREVTTVNGYTIEVMERDDDMIDEKEDLLFFINLGGYKKGLFDEPHFKLLTVQKKKSHAVKIAKDTLFYIEAGYPGADSHIDEHYGLDIDDIHNVRDILPYDQKYKYTLNITPGENNKDDELHLGYFKLSSF